MNRLAAVALLLREFDFPLRLAFGDRLRAGRIALHLPHAQRIAQLAERRLRVADDADIDRIDLADLLRLDVDLDQLCRRDREGVVRVPGTAVRFAEAGADREDDVGVARRFIGDARAPDA